MADDGVSCKPVGRSPSSTYHEPFSHMRTRSVRFTDWPGSSVWAKNVMLPSSSMENPLLTISSVRST
ncbi:MAG TPA: hypothetical protein VHH36_05000 [Candidatus Thermoplasmatota archaeon]|nr:hypothetical protein [Candidatus Thermoplasmatota archaeon]